MKPQTMTPQRMTGGTGTADIYVVGLGIKTVHHVTREAEHAMRSSNKIFYVDSGFGVEEYLTSLCPETYSMLDRYQEGSDRRGAYHAMAATVLDAALDDGPVCFATYGHPQVYVYPTRLIREAAALLGLTVRVIAGISALDSILIDLDIDPGPQGFQMYEATDVLTRARPLQPDVPCLLWQVSAVETALYSPDRGTAERFTRLQNYLLRFYPANHPVTMVLSSAYPLIESVTETFPLGELAVYLADHLQAGTMYLPPVEDRHVYDMELVRDIFDPSHLKAVTGKPH